MRRDSLARLPSLIPNDYAVGLKELGCPHSWKLTGNPLCGRPLRQCEVLQLENDCPARLNADAFFRIYRPFRYEAHRPGPFLFDVPRAVRSCDFHSSSRESHGDLTEYRSTEVNNKLSLQLSHALITF